MNGKFLPLFITNLLGVLNDNFLKTLACFIAIKWVSPEYASIVVSIAAAALVIPYLFFSPLGGSLAQRFNKERIVLYAKLLETPIMVVAIAGFATQSIVIVVFSILLMGLQSTLYSPAKYGLVREIGGQEGISLGMGGMEAVSFLGMLGGMLLAAFLVDSVPLNTLYMLLIGIAVLGFISSLTIKKVKEQVDPDAESSINPIKFLRDTYLKTKAYTGLHAIIITLSIFWWLAASIQIGLLIYCQQTLHLSSWHTGLMLSMAAVGITLGCFIAGVLCKKYYGLGWVSFAGWLIAAILLLIFFVPMSPMVLGIFIFALAVTAGMFKVPLDSAIVQIVEGPFLSIVLAYFNQVSFIFILLASATFALLSLLLPPVYLFLMLGLVFLIVPFYLMINYRPVLLYTSRKILSWRYKVKITGLENFKKEHNYLILPNHQAVVDPMILNTQLYKLKVRPLVDEGYFKLPIVGSLIRSFDAVSVPNLELSRKGVAAAAALFQNVHDALERGENVLLYPSGQITLDGVEELGNKQLAYRLCSALPGDTEVMAVKIHGLWGSVWSRYNRTKTPSLMLTLFLSIFIFLGGIFSFRKRREVTVSVEPMTDTFVAWSKEGKLYFNRHLEEYYNSQDEETVQCP